MDSLEKLLIIFTFMVPSSYWTSVVLHTYPPYPPEMISVRQYEVLLSLLSAITLLRPHCDSKNFKFAILF